MTPAQWCAACSDGDHGDHAPLYVDDAGEHECECEWCTSCVARVDAFERQLVRITDKIERVADLLAAREASTRPDSASIALPGSLLLLGRDLVDEGLELDRRLDEWLVGWKALNRALGVLAGDGQDVADVDYVRSGSDVVFGLAMRMQHRLVRSTQSQEHDTIAAHDAGVDAAIAKWRPV